ncbi:MAG: FAD:protein FMN transferase [Clostridia bacterium]
MRNRKLIFVSTFVFISAIIFFGCMQLFFNKEGTVPINSTFFVMDTVVDITIYTSDKDQAAKALTVVNQTMNDISNKFLDRYNPNSDIAKINLQAGITKVNVSEPTIEVIALCLSLKKPEFDIACAPLIELWTQAKAEKRVPTKMEISNVLPLIQQDLIEIDKKNHTVFLPIKGMGIDLGGIAKGYITEKIADIFKDYNFTGVLINAGGNIKVLGHKPKKTNWQIGIQNPFNLDKISATVTLSDNETAETSGNYMRYYEVAGVRYHHLLSPIDGYPVNYNASVTIISTDSALADYYSTYIFLLPSEQGLHVLETTPNIAGIIIDISGNIKVSNSIKEKVTLINE